MLPAGKDGLKGAWPPTKTVLLALRLEVRNTS